MKKILLFVIDSLTIGGAEKSLVSLLNLIDYTKYDVDLLLFRKGGELEKYLPQSVNILPVPEYYRFNNKERFLFHEKLKFYYYRLKTLLNLRLNNYRMQSLHTEQIVFKNIKKILVPIQKKYDVAIAYSQGMPTYFVANKVTASKKLAWINTDYTNSLYNKEIDFESYKEIQKIITVSKHINKSVSQIREEYNKKVELILDIINPSLIYKMSNEHVVHEFDKSVINILTVGRLVTAKGYDMAIEVAKLLKSSGYKFKWFVIGEGPERNKLQNIIDKFELNSHFTLLGKKINPYPYMKNCDLYVQTSIKEGFGLTVSEAKILKRPIVCTNFPTAKEIINNNVDGLIVECDIHNIYKGIKKYLDDQSFKIKIIQELNTIEAYNSVNQLNKFYQLVQN
ncbi:glycosyltransferase [Bacillus sp. EB600]|uniref:glycosyltransferase n=1 Tax=Bacillus sp. EB600 TaxID=2806345 RepID=UPI00210D7337|nr:glycosyltransferase [Bacillus sp. EB600]MCQ6278887.1 glycosyltransferase [Bacillus sp. EB600]